MKGASIRGMEQGSTDVPVVRHAGITRVWHWLNTLSLFLLFFSGLNISNAHPRLYWGAAGFDPRDAWFMVPRFPEWMTIPGRYDLAQARLWHLFAAWPLAIGLLVFLVASLITGHLARDIATSRGEWRPRAIMADLRSHLRFDFSAHDGRYNFLQKLLYGLVLFLGLPLMILTGLALSPTMDASWPLLVELFGGRQTARSIHFVTAWGLFGFFVLHMAALLAANPLRLIRGMITGRER